MQTEITAQAKRIALKYGRNYDEQQDIEGRCLEEAWLALPRVEQDKNPSAYLYKIMRNTALDYLKLAKKKETNLVYSNEALDLEELVLEKLLIQEAMKEFFNQLSAVDKTIVEMLAKGHSINEIAKEIKLTPNHVRVLIHRNRKEWREKFTYEKS